MNEMNDHLSRIQTHWSNVLGSNAGVLDSDRQQAILLRYYRAAFRYLLGILRDPDVAEELAQDFAVRFMRGDFRNVDRERGRFRDFLKTVLRNLCRDYWRKKLRTKEQNSVENAIEPPAPESEEALFEHSWREELLAKTWEALAQLEKTSGRPFFTALCLKVQEPNLRSPELALRLGKALDRSISADNLRQTLHRAREAFGDLLLREVELTLDTDDV